MKIKKALITGITGQDGSYLAEFLLSKGYEVHGIIRRSSTFNTQRIDHIFIDPHEKNNKLYLYYGDLASGEQIVNLINHIKPDEIYNLAAQSHVKVSFEIPEYTAEIDAMGTIRILEAIRRIDKPIKLYQASSSEMFGNSPPPQSEKTPFAPRSPYACAKVYSFWMTKNYREGYNLFISNGILFNHESPRRGETFVTRKITRALANILSNKQKVLYLGNLNAIRDWGFAPEYVEVMWKILQESLADDFVIGTGICHTVREFVENAFKYCGIEIIWEGSGINEVGLIKNIDKNDLNTHLKKGQVLIKIDKNYFRPTEVDILQADISKAKKILNWSPRYNFYDLIKIMVDFDLLRVGLKPIGEGINLLKEKELNWIKYEKSLINDRVL